MVNSSDVQSPKRIKLDPGVGSDNQEEDPPNDQNAELVDGEGEDENGENCSICLSNLEDRTVIPSCSHEFCFECLVVWTGQSRRCPLCNQPIGEYLIHNIRSQYDYRKHYLTPLRTTPPPQVAARRNVFTRQRQERRQRTRRTQEQLSEVDKFDRSLAKRRWIYRHDLYAKHVASNPHTKFRPYPKPSQFAASADLISRTTAFIRRELQVWEGMDVEFLTTLIISLMKSIDIRSESAVKLISEFLDLDAPYSPGSRQTNAEHFAHEVYSYVRSPYKDLFIYDNIVQYDTPAELPLPEEIPRRRRWDEVSRSRSRSPEFVQGSSRSAVDGTNGQLRSRTPPSPLRRRAPATSSEDVSRDDVDQDGRTSPSTPPEASGTSSRASKGKRKCMASESAPEALRIATTTTSSYSQVL
ncbi:hypothetical protein BKA70DRAFT_755062 [Coprinopsis sp. MPI-PUGE-AT-0042]|nr:hypothetical protein BKA70DRAFT_755062 [Coprinopsis sp. MPI-PUGE-AT-0042]